MGKRYFLFISLILLLLGGCKKEKDDEVYITIQPDWGKQEKPENLRVLLYEVGGEIIEYTMKSGGKIIKVPKGTYQVLVFNEDAKNVAFMELSSFDKAYAVMGGTKSGVEAPDGLYSYSGTITTAGRNLQLTPAMKSLIVKASFEINLEHAEGVADIRPSMRNVPDAVTLGEGIPFYTTPEQGNTIKMDPGTVSGSTYVFYCYTFGSAIQSDDPNPASRIFADIGITYENGDSKVITADVTEAITQASGEGGGEVVITMEEIGLTAVVKRWIIKKENGHIDDDK